VKKQQERDAKLLSLVQTMIEVYSFVDDVESLSQKISRLEDVVLEITTQTVECSIFIREYTGHGFSGKRFRVMPGVANASQGGLLAIPGLTPVARSTTSMERY
jgi:hypothetical protein